MAPLRLQSLDADMDGLVIDEETALGTDPDNPDSDNDGQNDGLEIKTPHQHDSQVFPRIPDNDADSLPNSFELLFGLDPSSPRDASEDLDSDGSSNLDEYIAGTDPSDPSDHFRITGLENLETEFKVTWPSIPGRIYTLSWSSDLTNWVNASVQTATSTSLSVTLDKTALDNLDGVTGNLSRIFVQVSVEAP